jgi:hypothetical protein
MQIVARTMALLAVCAGLACVPRASKLAIQGDARDQIWLAESSQVKVRASQSRIFDTTDERRVLEAVIATLQDLGFQVAVLDEVLGVVSGKKFVSHGNEPWIYDPYYSLYNDDSLVAFIKTYRTWGPFRHREDLVRLTVTVRERNAEQLIVRASAQYHLRPAEDPEPYQKFFRTLEQTLFVEQHLVHE